MKPTTPFISFTIASFIAGIEAQLTYRESPELQWDARVQSVREGNGVFLSPDEDLLVATSDLGYVTGFGAKDGSEIFQYTYDPNTTDIEFISSSSGISFSKTDFVVFSVLVNENSLEPLSRVVALSLTGQELWVSPYLKGLSLGTPVVSEDGAYVFLTHNSAEGTVGHFTILDGATGELYFAQVNEDAPFSPLAIFHNPAEGYYDGGQSNRNDILVWSVTPKPIDTSVGPGATFAFQFPTSFSGDPTSLSYTALGDEVKDFQTIQKPLIVDDGRTMYWGTSRSQFRCWIGEEGLDRYRFSRPRTSTVGFSRGSPPMQSVFATPVLSHDPANRFVFGGTAATEFVKMSADFSDEIMVVTNHLVKSSAHVSPDDAYVYYLEGNGHLHQAHTLDLQDRWTLDIGGTTEGEFSLSKDGTTLYVGDASGFIRAYRVGDVPTNAPSDSPSAVPTDMTTSVLTADTTAGPTLKPSNAPVPAPTPKPMAPSQEVPSGGNPPTSRSGGNSGSGIVRYHSLYMYLATVGLVTLVL